MLSFISPWEHLELNLMSLTLPSFPPSPPTERTLQALEHSIPAINRWWTPKRNKQEHFLCTL